MVSNATVSRGCEVLIYSCTCYCSLIVLLATASEIPAPMSVTALPYGLFDPAVTTLHLNAPIPVVLQLLDSPTTANLVVVASSTCAVLNGTNASFNATGFATFTELMLVQCPVSLNCGIRFDVFSAVSGADEISTTSVTSPPLYAYTVLPRIRYAMQFASTSSMLSGVPVTVPLVGLFPSIQIVGVNQCLQDDTSFVGLTVKVTCKQVAQLGGNTTTTFRLTSVQGRDVAMATFRNLQFSQMLEVDARTVVYQLTFSCLSCGVSQPLFSGPILRGNTFDRKQYVVSSTTNVSGFERVYGWTGLQREKPGGGPAASEIIPATTQPPWMSARLALQDSSLSIGLVIERGASQTSVPLPAMVLVLLTPSNSVVVPNLPTTVLTAWSQCATVSGTSRAFFDAQGHVVFSNLLLSNCQSFVPCGVTFSLDMKGDDAGSKLYPFLDGQSVSTGAVIVTPGPATSLSFASLTTLTIILLVPFRARVFVLDICNSTTLNVPGISTQDGSPPLVTASTSSPGATLGGQTSARVNTLGVADFTKLFVTTDSFSNLSPPSVISVGFALNALAVSTQLLVVVQPPLARGAEEGSMVTVRPSPPPRNLSNNSVVEWTYFNNKKGAMMGQLSNLPSTPPTTGTPHISSSNIILIASIGSGIGFLCVSAFAIYCLVSRSRRYSHRRNSSSDVHHSKYLEELILQDSVEIRTTHVAADGSNTSSTLSNSRFHREQRLYVCL